MKSFLRKNLFAKKGKHFYAQLLLTFFFILFNAHPISSVDRFYDSSYPSSRGATVYHQQEKDWVDLSPSSPLRQAACFAGKTYATSYADRELERLFPTRYGYQSVSWENIIARILLKGTCHFVVNLLAHYAETEKEPTQEQAKRMLYKTFADVAISELTNSFVPYNDRELVKAIALGFTHAAFKA